MNRSALETQFDWCQECTVRVLIVEDDYLIAETLSFALKSEGYEIVGPAETFEEAIYLCEKDTPDLALLNIDLYRHRGAGIEIARILLDKWGIESIFASGSIDTARESQAVVLAYIHKPYLCQTVVDAVKVGIERRVGLKKHNLPDGVDWFL